MDMEPDLPKCVTLGKDHHQKCLQCNRTKPLYLETDAWGIGLGAGLLQVWDIMNGMYDEATEATIIHP